MPLSRTVVVMRNRIFPFLSSSSVAFSPSVPAGHPPALPEPVGMAPFDPGKQSIHIGYPRHKQKPLSPGRHHPVQKSRHRGKGATPIQGEPQALAAKQAGLGKRKSVVADRQNHSGHSSPHKRRRQSAGGVAVSQRVVPPSAIARASPDRSCGSPSRGKPSPSSTTTR